MSGTDWIILAAIFLSTVAAIARGLFYELFSLAGVVVGYLLAVWRYRALAGHLQPYVNAPWVADIAAFLLIFLVVVILAGLIGRVTRRLLKEVGMSWFDRVLGGVFGLFRGFLMVAVVLLGMTSFAPSSQWLAGSQLAPYFLVAGRAAIWLAPSELRAQFYKGLDVLHHATPPPKLPLPASR
jgi:membrane protein required for colicin V production